MGEGASRPERVSPKKKKKKNLVPNESFDRCPSRSEDIDVHSFFLEEITSETFVEKKRSEWWVSFYSNPNAEADNDDASDPCARPETEWLRHGRSWSHPSGITPSLSHQVLLVFYLFVCWSISPLRRYRLSLPDPSDSSSSRFASPAVVSGTGDSRGRRRGEPVAVSHGRAQLPPGWGPLPRTGQLHSVCESYCAQQWVNNSRFWNC